MNIRKTMTKTTINLVLLSLSVSMTTVSHAISPINSTQDGRIIQAGTYYNTPNSHTTFLNSRSGDLWLQSGSTVRGLEVYGSGNLTNNGGNIQLYAPKSVVRVDGNIDVSGIINGQGAYLGNGGKVQVNATYLYQNGSITALGNQGGHLNINVNSATFTPLAKIDASSPNGVGGTIRINATRVVDIQKGAVLNTSGIPLPGVDSNVIQVVGRLVNNEGLINANGIISQTGQIKSASNGGIIQLIANNGNPNLQQVSKALANSTVFIPAEKDALLGQLQSLTNNYANSIRNTGRITANGGTFAIGPHPIASANGGQGGVISLMASRSILNQTSTSVISAKGGFGRVGGNGGQIQFSNQQRSFMSLNEGEIEASGGNGEGIFTPNLPTPKGISGNGGTINLRNFTNSGTVSVSAGGGAFGIPGGIGGDGGTINATNILNTALGEIVAFGGAGTGGVSAVGGTGGTMKVTNFTNQGTVKLRGGVAYSDNDRAGTGGLFFGTNVINSGTLSANGGESQGSVADRSGDGGSVQITNLSNTGLIEANGGLFGSVGGNGGFLSFNRVNNSGIITANGANSDNGPAGNGGTIIGTHVMNTGNVQVQGGISAIAPDLNGKDGTVIGF